MQSSFLDILFSVHNLVLFGIGDEANKSLVLELILI